MNGVGLVRILELEDKCAFTILTSKENEGLVKDILKERRHIDERL